MTDKQEVLELTPEFVAVCQRSGLTPIEALNGLQKVVIYLDQLSGEIDLEMLDQMVAECDEALK